MSSIAIGEAKANFSKLVREVRKGRRFIIMDGREPVADLVPHLSIKGGPRVVAASTPPSRRLVASARRHIAKMRSQRGKSGARLEKFIEDARAEL